MCVLHVRVREREDGMSSTIKTFSSTMSSGDFYTFLFTYLHIYTVNCVQRKPPHIAGQAHVVGSKEELQGEDTAVYVRTTDRYTVGLRRIKLGN